MAKQQLTKNYSASLESAEVITKASSFFSQEKWKVTSQTPQSVILQGKPAFPWGMLFLTLIGFVLCLIPGIIMHAKTKKRTRQVFHLIVNATPIPGGSEVTFQYPNEAEALVSQFITTLPVLNA